MRVFRHIILCLALFVLVGCVEPIVAPQPVSGTGTGTGIELTLVCDEAIQTKATEPGVRAYHENLISWVDFYFFAGALPDDASAAAEWKQTATALIHHRLISGEQDTASFQINISGTTLQQLFPETGRDDRDTMTVLAVANFPKEQITQVELPTFAALDSVVVTTDFVSPSDHRQPRFMMRGVEKIRVIDRQADLVCKGTIHLERYAAKMTVAVHVKDTVHLAMQEDPMDPSYKVPEVWRPMLDGMEMYLDTVVNTVRLSGKDDHLNTIRYFTYYNNRLRFVSKDRQGNLTPLVWYNNGYYDSYPLYMYPQGWEYGSDEAPNKEPSLKLIIPWHREEYKDPVHDIYIPPTQKQCYYKVVMPAGFNKEFLANHWYHLNLDVKILGALTEEQPVTIEGSCVVVSWQNRDVVIKQAEVGRARYLAIDRNEWEMSNVNTLDIPYVTSHPVVIDPASIRVTRPFFGESLPPTDTLGGVVIDSLGTRYLLYDEAHRKAMNGGEDWFYDSGSAIQFRHILNNNYLEKRFDYSPYTITFRIKHGDDDQYQQDVKIIQYPAIYISRIRNSDPVEENGEIIAVHTENKSNSARSKYNGFVIVDGAWEKAEGASVFTFYPGKQQKRFSGDEAVYNSLTSTEKKDYQWRAVHYTGGSIDMFNIHISVLPTEFDFVIGDPRVMEIDNLGYSFAGGTKLVPNNPPMTFAKARAMYGQRERTLAYYYPTEASERTRNMLAPSYRICSKFGGIEFNGITLEYARYRCAAYQEDGFPAGRWRVPTQAEVGFIAQLSANKAFATLFNVGDVYWSANGAVKVNASGVVPDPNKSSTALLRCVYDTWYWGDDQSEYDTWRRREAYSSEGYLHDLFVWGDKPR